MIKAIIFDFFDVLVSDGERAFYEKHVPEGSEMASQCQAIEDAFMAGKINYEIYQQKLADVTGVSRDEVGAWLADNHINKSLFHYIQNQLRPSYKLGIISNAGGDWVDDMLGKQNALLFDEIVLSFEVKYMKPALEIYQIALDRLGIQPHEAIFIDDKQKYVEAAKTVGMTGITFSSTEQCIKDIESALITHEN